MASTGSSNAAATVVARNSDDTMLRIEALNFALRYEPNSADQAVADAETYLAFLKP